jgi:hypothetical protein
MSEMSEFEWPGWDKFDDSEWEGVPTQFRHPLRRENPREFIEYVKKCPQVEATKTGGGSLGIWHLAWECVNTRRYYLCRIFDKGSKTWVKEVVLPMGAFNIEFECFPL